VTLTIRLLVNDYPIEVVHIRNMGNVDPEVMNDPEGERRYIWVSDTDWRSGELVHRRGDGALVLTAKVCEALAAAKRE
jgi:hypothetical protein